MTKQAKLADFTIVRNLKTYRGKVILVLEVDDYRETKRYEIDDERVVQQILSCEQSWSFADYSEIIEPNHSPINFTKMESIVVQPFKRTIEV